MFTIGRFFGTINWMVQARKRGVTDQLRYIQGGT
jgi:hypothetical protein